MDEEGNLAFAAIEYLDSDGNVDRWGSHLFAIIGGELHRVAPRFQGDFGQIHVEGAQVSFGSIGTKGGIFRWANGGSGEIAGSETLVPDQEDCLLYTKEEGISVQPFLVDGDTVLFSGTPGTGCDAGTFLWRSGVIARLGGVSSQASIDEGLIAFLSSDGAIYHRDLEGSPKRLVGPGDPVPGRLAFFDSVWEPAAAAGRIAFMGRDQEGTIGAYLWDRGALSVLAEEGTQLPGGGSLAFDALDPEPVRLGADRVAVLGTDGQRRVLYLASLDGSWEKVVDLADLFISGSNVGGFDRGELLIGDASYAYVVRRDTSLVKVLEYGDVLDGQVVTEIDAGDLRRSRLSLGVELSGRRYIYLAELPPLAGC